MLMEHLHNKLVITYVTEAISIAIAVASPPASLFEEKKKRKNEKKRRNEACYVSHGEELKGTTYL